MYRIDYRIASNVLPLLVSTSTMATSTITNTTAETTTRPTSAGVYVTPT